MQASQQSITILHTNDIHSHFEMLPKIASIMDLYKLSHSSEELLILDCGDHMDRMSMETEGSDGLANVEIMNALGYEAVVLGNNEGLTYTAQTLANTYKQAQFKVIGSNLFELKTGMHAPWTVPYEIISKGTLKIGVIGVTAPFSDFYQLLGWDVRNPFETVDMLVQELRPMVHIIIVLSHLGLPSDRQMAEQIAGIDCILGGHTHHLLTEPLVIGDSLVCCAGKFGQYVGAVTISYDLTEQAISHIAGVCIETTPYPDNRMMAGIVDRYRALSHVRLSAVAATLRESLAIDWNADSPLGNLLASGLRNETKAEIGLVNAGQILHSLEAGDITLLNLLEICPSPINPCRMNLTGKQIKVALEESLIEDFMSKTIRGFGFRGQVLGTLCLNGITVDYDLDRPAYERILTVNFQEAPMDLNRIYSVGTIDMFTFGIGYTSLSKGTDIEFFLPQFIRDVLRKQLLIETEIADCKPPRWRKLKN